MKELVIISGKGGTGKTSLTASMAILAQNCVLCDADVDAADLHLLLKPELVEKHDFKGGGLAEIEADKCTACGLCHDLCRFDAVDNENWRIDPVACEGCGVCVDLCPEQAIAFPEQKCGEWFISKTRVGPMVHARLGIAEENSGKLVTLIRQQAQEVASRDNLDLIITDGPPGIGCPVIASIGGAAAVLIVTEPTVAGVHDLQRVTALADHFKVPCMVLINKFDLNADNTRLIRRKAAEAHMPVVGEVPFDPVFTQAMVQGQTAMEYNGAGKIQSIVKKVWEAVLNSPAMRD